MRKILGLLFALILLSQIVYGNSQTIVVLPDTQYYAKSYPAIFTNQTQWAVNNVNTRNLSMLIHVGDVVEHWNYVSEWQNANTSLSLLDTIMPYSVAVGNHDNNQGSPDHSYYNTYFNYTRYSAYDWYGGHYPTEGGENSYQYFNLTDTDKWMVITTYYNAGSADFAWANSTAIANSDKSIIYVYHDYLYWNGKRSAMGEIAWNSFVKHHSNIKMVLCGHWDDGDGSEAYSVSIGDNDNLVHQILSDYQFRDNGGDGWLRLMEFTNNNTVNVTTYSPYRDEYENDADSQFFFYLEPVNCSDDIPASGDWVINSSCYLKDEDVDIGDYDINITLMGQLWLEDTNITFGKLNIYESTGSIGHNLLVIDMETDNVFNMSGV